MTFKNLLLLSLAALLAISLVLNYYFYKKAFIPLHLTKLDPVGLNYYPSNDSGADRLSGQSIMLFGDSRALSWPVEDTKDYHFINRAIGNQTSTQIVQRFAAHVAPHEPHLIVLQMCVNDLKMIPLFPTQKDKIIQDCKDNIQRLITDARQIGAKVALTTVFPLGDVSIARKAFGIREQPIIDGIEAINQFIQTLSADDVFIFDSYQHLVGEQRKINPRYSSDWLHLNGEGYSQLNEQLRGFLKRTLREN